MSRVLTTGGTGGLGRVLVTGGAGVLGSEVARRLIVSDFKGVRVMTRLRRGRPDEPGGGRTLTGSAEVKVEVLLPEEVHSRVEEVTSVEADLLTGEGLAR